MLQQVIALIIIAYFLARLFWQKQKNQISINEFIFWLLFWLIAAGAILLLKWIDELVASLGFSASGIEILLYLAIATLFYFIFRLRLRFENIEKNLTKIVRGMALNKKTNKNNKN